MNLRHKLYKQHNTCSICGRKKGDTFGHYQNTLILQNHWEFDKTIRIKHECSGCKFVKESIIVMDYYSLLKTIKYIMNNCPAKSGYSILFSEIFIQNVPYDNSNLEDIEQYKDMTASIVISHDQYYMLCNMIEEC